jgi:predicted RND superfamily exporter protein
VNISIDLSKQPVRGVLPRIEAGLFGHRGLVLVILALFTAAMAWFAVQLRMDAGFEKQLPIGHEYIETFQQYRADLLGANRLTLVGQGSSGQIWTEAGLRRLADVTQAVTFLPGISRSSVRSLWTPNAFVNEITEDGFRADPLVPARSRPSALTPASLRIADSTAQGGFVGTLVSRDQSSAMITAELNERDANGERSTTWPTTTCSKLRSVSASRMQASKSRSSALPSRSATSPMARRRCWSSACWRCC